MIKPLRGIADHPPPLLVLLEVTNRYEILDILSQDGSGVSFHAQDRESGKEVVVRRFFPFGTDGGGLQGEEKLAYEIGVKRLQEISHPALRSVLDGGTDPVDGMPFLVTEWLEGEMLSERMKDGHLSPESVRAIADLALETSQILSEAFGEEAIWIETDPTTIIVSDQDAARQVTFWISPLRWLGDPSVRSDLKPLLEMVETLSGWRGQMISRSSGAGLGAWVKTLRDEPNTWTLAQAKAALHEPATIVEASAAEAQANPVAAALPPAPAPQQVVFVNRPVIWPWLLSGILALGAAGILLWRQMNPPIAQAPAMAQGEPAQRTSAVPKSSPTPAATTPKPTPTPKATSKPASSESSLEAINRRAAEMAAEAEASILITSGEKATLAGIVTSTESSSTGKSHYLQFKTDQGDQVLWAMFRSSDWKDFDLGTLKDFEGKHARFSGRWSPESSRRKMVLRMTNPEQLELLD
ncbi:hypothetical protein [Haloferula sp.]|uniref:hypothetical protein n=1 Tax=Haloferula sp. TaxID=2497595 RepID=UPI003C72D7D5